MVPQREKKTCVQLRHWTDNWWCSEEKQFAVSLRETKGGLGEEMHAYGNARPRGGHFPFSHILFRHILFHLSPL